MKLSFSISSKSANSRPVSSKPLQSFDSGGDNPREDGLRGSTDEHQATPQFVTSFDPSEKLASDVATNRIITPIPNVDFRFRKKMKNLPLPTTVEDSQPESHFVLHTSENGFDDSSANGYGLMLRSTGAESKPLSKSEGNGRPELPEDQLRRLFREEIKDLPEEELPDLPIEGWGAAILSGYGWSEGKSIGRNVKEDAKVFEYKRRAGTEGLGYMPDAPNPKSSEKKSQKEDITSGFSSSVRKEDIAVHREERKGENIERNSRREEKRKDRKLEKSSREYRHSRDEEPKPVENSHERSVSVAKAPIQWLRSHIRVRIISKKFRDGKFYLKKGEVVDVIGPTTCDITMDGNRELVQGVDQEILETAIPKCGGSVLVLYGKHKGVFGSLVDRDSENETGTVRDADSKALFNVRLEQIAEYVGDPRYLGY
ncbi:hypothetical protein HPP92_014007 [Vanilla planifolia]|uniref:G-patch domain-containing protein n=1 Tax=Vanilla planifolia TaxID=51239 RepID=A0A835QJ82_VANPL|nr:hypothetical protein HPP92_014007 [Vanilla planifolia]